MLIFMSVQLFDVIKNVCLKVCIVVLNSRSPISRNDFCFVFNYNKQNENQNSEVYNGLKRHF